MTAIYAASIVTLALAVLKLTEVIAISWMWVFSPFLIGMAIFAILLVCLIGKAIFVGGEG